MSKQPPMRGERLGPFLSALPLMHIPRDQHQGLRDARHGFCPHACVLPLRGAMMRRVAASHHCSPSLAVLCHHGPRPPPPFPPRARQARLTRCRCRWRGPYPASGLPPTASARPALRLKGRAVGTGHKLRAQALWGRCAQSFCPVPERAAGAHAARTPLLSPSQRHLTPRRNDITVRRGRRAGPTVLQPSVG